MTNHVLKHHNKALQSILLKVEQLRELNQLFAQHLPAETIKHCEIVKFEKNCLFVLVDSGNWTTQLRFQIPELMEKLRKHPSLAQLNGIICKTRPHHSLSKIQKPPIRTVKRLSNQSSEAILAIAQKINDKNLQTILTKIACHLIKY